MAKTKPSTQTRIKFISQPEIFIRSAEELLNSPKCIKVLGGLVLVTGLASDSLLANSNIQQKTTYSVTFTQKKNFTEVPREIPTLIKAEKVIKAISFLRDSLDISHLESKTINTTYIPSVYKVWLEHFHKFLPLGPKSQFSHQTWRLIYAAIATHWYCPPTVGAIDYKAYICGQGDLILDKAQNIKEKIATQLNYFEYQIEGRKNKIDERVGLKLSEPDVQVLEKFQPLEFVDKLPKVSEFDAQALGPETKPNGKTEESLKPTQQEANTDIISSKVSEFHSEFELDTVVETSKDAENSQENLNVIEPETQIELEVTEVSEEKTELTPSQVRETSPDAPKAQENVGVTEPETQIDSKSVEVLEKKSNLAAEQVAQTQSLNGQVVENISETEPEKVILLKLASDQSEVLLEGLEEATGCTPSTLLLGNIYRVSKGAGESQLVLKQGKIQQPITTVVEGDIIIKAISRLRKFPELKELLKLSPEQINEQFRVKAEVNGSIK